MVLVLGTPSTVVAQQHAPAWRVGVLMYERAGALEAVIDGLRELNYVEGRNVTLDVRRATNRDELAKLAAEMVRRDPHVVIAVSGRAAAALKATTGTVPIVMASSGDAVREGLIASLPRPGGNVTGLTFISPDITAKRLQILKEAAPAAGRIGVFGCGSSHPVTTAQWSEVESAAKVLGVQIVPVKVSSVDDFSRAFESLRRERVQALFVLDCSWFPVERLTALVGASRVPALYPYPRYVRAGGLMSYGPNSEKEYRRAAIFVDKILKGAKPAELPVEQPKNFDLIVNLRTAKVLGLTLPPSLLARADQVIE
jgi:putative tryptophan/tyrosine transport system substrate-binding protein